MLHVNASNTTQHKQSTKQLTEKLKTYLQQKKGPWLFLSKFEGQRRLCSFQFQSNFEGQSRLCSFQFRSNFEGQSRLCSFQSHFPSLRPAKTSPCVQTLLSAIIVCTLCNLFTWSKRSTCGACVVAHATWAGCIGASCSHCACGAWCCL